MVAIFCNLFLSFSKIVAGSTFGVISLIADGFNNLSDLGGNLIMILSAKISSKPADKEHPYGHQRVEYIATLVLVFLIFLLSFELIKSAIAKILHPQPYEYSPVIIIILVLSIVVKTFMFLFNRRLGKITDSSVLKAIALDSITDSVSTVCILIGIICSRYFNFNFDPPLAILVALIVLYAGIKILKDTFNQLLGRGIDEKKAKEIKDKILSYNGILGVHDLMGHYYGKNNLYASAHVEVDAKIPIMESHDLIDRIEQDFSKEIQMVIHMDPIKTDDPYVNETKEKIKKIISDINPKLSIHDFRMVIGNTHTNVLFDIVIPFEIGNNYKDLIKEIVKKCKELDNKFIPKIQIDRE